MFNISAAFNREPDPFRLAQLETYVAEALRKSEGEPNRAFHLLIGLAEKESELGDLVSDVMALAFSRHFYRTVEHLQHTI